MPSNTRFTLGKYIAEVLPDERHQANVYHWIVQQIGSPSVVMSGQECSYKEACSEAKFYLRSLVRANKNRRA